jgi:hypothetical protein
MNCDNCGCPLSAHCQIHAIPCCPGQCTGDVITEIALPAKEACREIGDIGNYYGGLCVRESAEQFFWAIEDYAEGPEWEEIPKSLYDELMRYQDGIDSNESRRKNGVV